MQKRSAEYKKKLDDSRYYKLIPFQEIPSILDN